jgi:hypothetical protein
VESVIKVDLACFIRSTSYINTEIHDECKSHPTNGKNTA